MVLVKSETPVDADQPRLTLQSHPKRKANILHSKGKPMREPAARLGPAASVSSEEIMELAREGSTIYLRAVPQHVLELLEKWNGDLRVISKRDFIIVSAR